MTRATAREIVLQAATMRLMQWEDVADGEDVWMDELLESDTEKGQRMAERLREALMVVRYGQEA